MEGAKANASECGKEDLSTSRSKDTARDIPDANGSQMDVVMETSLLKKNYSTLVRLTVFMMFFFFFFFLLCNNRTTNTKK